ncbi:nucleoside 2-deoxyribosyltransferase [Hansschlegelia sp. KR7-227]|uniref:nucleoside 2-deoxyribosyltransferase n=1 Tax=Hansschlegelia sp. KR7-227 TaxID=3400914 RepID=UPI003C056E51
MRIYLAGPEVFLADALAAGEAKKAICARHGVEGLYPLDGAVADDEPNAAAAIFAANVAMIERADAVIANLTPFRGLSADAGTAVEVGLGFAMGKPVHGYTNGSLSYFERAAGAARETLATAPDGRPLHADGLAIEDFGLADNLMLIEAIRASGGVFLSPAVGSERPIEDLTLFGTCLALVASAPRKQTGRQAAQRNASGMAG